ncbi:MAG: formate dehydrogenase subunit gamma [Nitrospirota bacterium]|jgi:formate dehydrogenase subunit gamma
MKTVEKSTAWERFNHLVLLVSFFVLMLTGLGFLFNSLHWMSRIFFGTQLAAEIHKWGGVVFTASLVLTMGSYLGEALSWSKEDSEWLSGLGGYLSKKKMPEQGRLNAGQKLFYLTLLVTGLVMAVSGLIIWLSSTQGPMRWGFVLHNLANVVLVTIIPLHVYMATLANPGTARIMGRGTVPLEWAKKKHAKWVKTLGAD